MNSAFKLIGPLFSIFLFLPLGFGAQPEIHIGGKNFTEQILLVKITQKFLEAKGYKVKTTTGLGTLVLRKAFETNQIDLGWDYTGTGLVVYFHVKEQVSGRKSYEKIRDLDKPNKLIWLEPSSINNTYVLTMRKTTIERLSIQTISDLIGYLSAERQRDPKKKYLFAVEYEFASRPDGLIPFQKKYQFEFNRQEIKQMDPGLVYTALKNNQVFVGLAFASDGRIDGFQLSSLRDDKHFFPAYFATPVIRADILEKNPELKPLLLRLSQALNTKKMMKLNKAVDIDHRPSNSVADEFLESEGLLQ